MRAIWGSPLVALGLLLSAGCGGSTMQPSGTWLQGVNHASLEYGSNVFGKAPCVGDGPFGVQELVHIRTDWNSDMVRIPLSSNNWLGDYDAQHGTNYGHEGNVCPGYDAWVGSLARAAAVANVRIVFALAYVDPCSKIVSNSAGAGYDLPGQDEAVHFWQTLASDATVIHNRYVWLDAYSEPHDVSWAQWYSGGQVTQAADNKRARCTYQAAGMAELASVIRAAAPERTIVISGNNWAGDITQLNDFTFDEGNLYFGIHIYPGPNTKDEAGWPIFFANMANYPVVATEFGTHDCSTVWVDDLMRYLRAHAKGMLAWGYNRGDCQGPRLLDQNSQVNAYGANIRSAFRQNQDVAEAL